MFRFIGGVALGIVIGLYLGSIPAISQGLAEVGKILSISALATLLSASGVATSADEAKKLRYLRQTDGISLNRAELLESVMLVQRNVARIRRLQIGGDTVTVAVRQGVTEERGAVALALGQRIDSNQRQVPAVVGRVILLHLREHLNPCHWHT